MVFTASSKVRGRSISATDFARAVHTVRSAFQRSQRRSGTAGPTIRRRGRAGTCDVGSRHVVASPSHRVATRRLPDIARTDVAIGIHRAGVRAHQPALRRRAGIGRGSSIDRRSKIDGAAGIQRRAAVELVPCLIQSSPSVHSEPGVLLGRGLGDLRRRRAGLRATSHPSQRCTGAAGGRQCPLGCASLGRQIGSTTTGCR